MKRLTLKIPDRHCDDGDLANLDDCERLHGLLREQGIPARIRDCYELWKAYSDELDAGWIDMDGLTDANILDSVAPYYLVEAPLAR